MNLTSINMLHGPGQLRTQAYGFRLWALSLPDSPHAGEAHKPLPTYDEVVAANGALMRANTNLLEDNAALTKQVKEHQVREAIHHTNLDGCRALLEKVKSDGFYPYTKKQITERIEQLNSRVRELENHNHLLAATVSQIKHLSSI